MLSVAGGDAWKNFAVEFADPNVHRLEVAASPWQNAVTMPCPAFAKAEYSYRTHTYTTFQVWQAQSNGYESPSYRWYLGNLWLDPASPGHREVEVACRSLDGSQFAAPTLRTIGVTVAVMGSRPELLVDAPYADIDIPIRVEINESSPEVMRNLYPERSATLSTSIDNLEVEWDAEYLQAFENCWKKYLTDKRKVTIPIEHRAPRRDRRPQYLEVAPERLIRDLLDRDPRAAVEVAAEIAKVANLPVKTVLADAFER